MSDFETRLTQLRQDLHRHPELGFQETRTKAVIAERLRAMGIEVHEGAGVVGVLRSGGGNTAIGLRPYPEPYPDEFFRGFCAIFSCRAGLLPSARQWRDRNA